MAEVILGLMLLAIAVVVLTQIVYAIRLRREYKRETHNKIPRYCEEVEWELKNKFYRYSSNVWSLLAVVAMASSLVVRVIE